MPGRVRPDPAIPLAAIVGDDEDEGYPTRAAGSVPSGWLDDRRMGVAALDASFCDIAHSDSLIHLREALAGRLLHFVWTT